MKYRYRKTVGSGGWTGSSWSGNVAAQSEQLVMQILRKRHPGYEVELIEIRWK
ncbi:hypothetical protein H9645_05485 [Luteimonas sp. Sa2BVA3]|uniref:DUF4136 domain-containing protein n=1 Tax=Luteimonas colneyensis TaxID=2762230 RepID=A0ABR8UHH8_9GAMM|nr:hypothetical protein [Luteimonas colneyensis]MBD7987477.1 hypothetical protein [Luteimonas colneyensis]